MWKKKKNSLLIALVLALSEDVFADQLLKTMHIGRVFAESEATGGFYTVEPLPECKWGLMYIDLAKESGKAIFTIVLAAKTTGEPVVRIDYTVNSGGTCVATGVHGA